MWRLAHSWWLAPAGRSRPMTGRPLTDSGTRSWHPMDIYTPLSWPSSPGDVVRRPEMVACGAGWNQLSIPVPLSIPIKYPEVFRKLGRDHPVPLCRRMRAVCLGQPWVRPVYQSRIIEVFDASLGQVGDEPLPTPDARIQQHIKFRVGKLLVKCHARFGNDARREVDMLLTNSGRKGNIIVLEDLTLPHDPIQKRDQGSSRGKVTLPHESVVCIKR